MPGPTADERFRAIFDAYHGDIQRYCARRLHPDDANDAAADVFLVLWRRLSSAPTGHRARLWLFGVARNVVRQHRRSRGRAGRLWGRLRESAPGGGADEPASAAIRADQQRVVAEAMEQLPARDREVLRLKLWEDLSHREIAVVLGISPHAVDMRAHRALDRVSGMLIAASDETYPSAGSRRVKGG